MTYREFNYKVFHFYQTRSSSSFCFLTITQKEIETIIPVEELSSFTELRWTWNSLLEIKDSLPQYFGLIAIQCFAASQMRRDELNAQDAYKIRLCEILHLPDNQLLHLLFRGNDPERPVQEEIWYQAKAYLKHNFQQELDLPLKSLGAWRYVRYPISQALLNLEDLRYFTRFFADEFFPGEDVPFSFFERRLESAFCRLELTPRAAELMKNENKRVKCIQQICEYFHSWQGEVYGNPGKVSSHKKHKSIETKNLYTSLLLFANGSPRFYLVSRDTLEVIGEAMADDLFQSKNVIKYHDGLFLFTETEYYPGEYEASRFLYEEMLTYVLIDANVAVQEYRFLEANYDSRNDIGDNKILYSFRLTKHHRLFAKFIQPYKSVQFTGGIRISRRRIYLIGYGPNIHCDRPYCVILNNMICDYEPFSANCGIYYIRVNGSKDIEFQIVPLIELESQITTKNKGWDLATYSIQANPNMEGLLLKFAPQIDFQVATVKQWISINLSTRRQKQPYSNYLLNAINNSK